MWTATDEDQQGCNLPQFTDSKFLVRKQIWRTTGYTGVHAPTYTFHTSAPGVKAVEFPPLNCALLSPQTDGSSFAEKDGQSLVVPAHHLLDFGAWVCWLSFRN